MDNLEEYIRKNREKLDTYSPSSGVWENIHKDLKKEKSPYKRLLSIAAMIIVILGCAVLFELAINRLYETGNEITVDSGTDLSNPHLEEAEIYYNNLVNSLYREATPLMTANPEIEKEFTADISQLDSLCLEIKKDLKDNIANQEVVEALMQNYRIKIRLLEDMLTILKENEDNQEKNQKYEL